LADAGGIVDFVYLPMRRAHDAASPTNTRTVCTACSPTSLDPDHPVLPVHADAVARAPPPLARALSTLDSRPLDPSTASPPPPPLRHFPRHGRQRSPARLRAGAGRAQCHAVGGQPRTERAGPRVSGEVPEVGTFVVAPLRRHAVTPSRRHTSLTQCATARGMDCHPGHARVELGRRCGQAVRCHDAQGQGASLLPAARCPASL
jgi:hypothetical protein